jgi:protease I
MSGPPWAYHPGRLRGRRLTSYHCIQDEIRNAGGYWLDRDVVEHGK